MKPRPDQLLILNNLADGSAVWRRDTQGVLADAINTQGVLADTINTQGAGHSVNLRYSTTVLQKLRAYSTDCMAYGYSCYQY